MIARARGYNCYIVMPDDQAAEKYAILEHLGATIEKVRPVSIADPNHFTRYV
jgi:cysteine synthase A